MIPASEALSLERLKAAPPLEPLKPLTPEADAALDYVDSIVEGSIFKHFDGKSFVMPVPSDYVHVVDALRQRYEEGGWATAAFPQREGDIVKEIHVLFTPRGVMSTANGEVTDELPPVSYPYCPPALPKRLLVRMPTRGRPAQALRVLQKYRDMAGMPVTIEVVIDEDDETMLAAPVLQRLCALGCIVTVGPHKSKVEAVNGGRRDLEWDVLLLASDDMWPVTHGYAVEAMRAMEEHWPHLDGAVFFDDGYAREKLCTLPVLGRRLYQQLGYVYAPEYKSLCCDVEQTELLRAMGRLTYINKKIIEHKHPAAGKAAPDALYARNDALHKADLETLETRRGTRWEYASWGFDSPPMLLSICIASLPARRAQLDRLLDHLYGQDYRWRSREIVVDDAPGNVGEKRQRLLERAKGMFVAFVDDDDWVDSEYVSRVLSAIERNLNADCVSLVGSMTTLGSAPHRFEHSIKHKKWQTEGGTLVRPPNHLNPVRRNLALMVGFQSAEKGEDHDYSMRLQPLLEVETSTGDAPLYYYWYAPT